MQYQISHQMKTREVLFKSWSANVAVLQSSRQLKGFDMKKMMTQQEKQEAYNAWFVAEVDKGLADIEAGDVLTEEEAEAHMENFFANLATASRKAA